MYVVALAIHRDAQLTGVLCLRHRRPDLSTYGEDFTGGKFVFYDDGSNHTIEPRAGACQRQRYSPR